VLRCAVQVLIEQLDAHLIVFSPYLSLTQLLQSDASLADLSQNAWAALNDSYRTDVALVYPPHLLAVAVVYLASVICSRDLQTWMQELAVDMNHVSSRGGARAR
jgi:cyclin C